MSKKQFIALLVGGALVFFVTFGACYMYFYYQGIKEPLVTAEYTETSVTFAEEVLEVQGEEQPLAILPSTKVELQVVDEQYKTVLKKTLETQALLGFTEEDIKARFTDCVVLQFDAKEVILQRQVVTMSEPTTYSLVIQGGILGILETGSETQFIPLNLSENIFTMTDLALFGGEGLSITLKQKMQLQQEPYYIEHILQSYHE